MGVIKKAKAWPLWLYSLLSTSFFRPCKFHKDSSKNECNMYCLDCMNGAICSSCLIYHHDHHTVQIRRSSYHDVVRVSEINKFLDLSGVQTYIINSARIVFLNERPQPRLGKGVSNTCEHCRRSLLDAFTFCSLGCKLAISTSNSAKFYTRQENTKPRSEDDSSKQSECTYSDDLTLDCMSPLRPAPAIMTHRMTKRRKGIPRRAPLGVC